tara:strand:- start:145 stop:618 length:474 start_codon:yes stop_codon:yes gene_type:complete
MSDVRFTGEYLFEDFLESHQAAAAKRRLAIRVVICIVAVLMLVQESWIERSLGLVALAYAFFVSGWIFRWLVKLQWSAFRAANKQTADFRFGGEGVTSVDAEGASSLVSWEQFTRWSEGARMILLFRSPHLWLMVPKRLLREKQLDALRAMLKDRVG